MTEFAWPVVAADIGGTNVRFAWLEHAEAEPVHLAKLRTNAFDTLTDALNEALAQARLETPKTGLFAGAGPIRDDGLDLTNAKWIIRPPDVLDRTGLREVVLFNDFEAQALALPFLGDDDLHRVGGAGSRDDRTKAVIGPGTGLGVGVLARAGGRWIVVPGEGGHVDIGPRDRSEHAVFEHIERIGGRVSGEQALSGNGLMNLYRAVCRAADADPVHDDPADVTDAALGADDDAARRALTLFCTLLGRLAGDVALTVMAKGGVYIGGGIVPRILDFLDASPFRDAFEDKAPHEALMRACATAVVTADVPALEGLLGFARDPDAFIVELAHRRWQAD